MTEEFFGDGKKRKVIKILKKDVKNHVKNKNEQLSQQPSSSSGQYLPQALSSTGVTMDQNDEDELDANRKLIGAVRKQLADEKSVEGVRTLSKSGDERQHDKKGAREKALREKTQIEFFEREKLFANDDNRYGEKLKNQKRQPSQILHRHRYPFIRERPAVIRLTTASPIQIEPQITKVIASDDANGSGNDEETDFQSLHDLLLKRLKGWREKGYKITTELEIIQRGAVHDKERSVRQRGKGEHKFQRFEGLHAVKSKAQASDPEDSLGDQRIKQLEPLTVTYGTPDKEKFQYQSKVIKKNNNNNDNQNSNSNINNDNGNNSGANNDDEEDDNQGNIFSSLPKFISDKDYEAELDGPDDKVVQINELVQHNPRQALHLPPPSIQNFVHHHQQPNVLLSPSPQTPPQTQPEALKLTQPLQQTLPKVERPLNVQNFSSVINYKPVRKGKKYVFKGMIRKIPTKTNEGVKGGEQAYGKNGRVNGNRIKVSSSATPSSTSTTDSENFVGKGNLRSPNIKVKDAQSSRRLTAQKRLKAKQKAKLDQKKKQMKNQLAQQQSQKQLDEKKPPNRNLYRAPMSIQDQIFYQASPLVDNSGQGGNEGVSLPPNQGVGLDLNNPLNFLDGVNEGIYMQPEGGFDEMSFGNPTLLTLPGILDSPVNENDAQITEHFRFLSDQGQGGGNIGNNGGKQSYLSYHDLSEPTLRSPTSPPTPHTEILIGKPGGPKQLSSPNPFINNSGQYRDQNKIRDYPNSIQDITRGKKGTNSYIVEPNFGREAPETDLVLNQFKGNGNNLKLSNDWTNQDLALNNEDNIKDTPMTFSWLKKDKNFNQPNSRPQTTSWDSKSQQNQSPNFNSHNFNQQSDPNLIVSVRGEARYSTPKPIDKLKLVVHEPLELIPDSMIKPGHYPQSAWADPGNEINNYAKKKNKNKKRKTSNRIKEYQQQRQQHQQFIEDPLSIGFDSQRMRSPKSADLLTHSSQIYPLIGGYSPFIMPSMSPTIYQESQFGGDDDDADSGYDGYNDDKDNLAYQGINQTSGDFFDNVNNDSVSKKEYETEEIDKTPTKTSQNTIDTAHFNSPKSGKDQINQQQPIIEGNKFLISINDQTKIGSSEKPLVKDEIERPSKWSEPCPNCPVF